MFLPLMLLFSLIVMGSTGFVSATAVAVAVAVLIFVVIVVDVADTFRLLTNLVSSLLF